jgi:hypothetical protein
MMNQLLAPGVEDGEETQLGAQMFRIGGDGAERRGRGLEQQIVNHCLVLQGQVGNGLGQGKDNVEIDDGQELLLTGGDPAGLGQGLALGAMTIAAGVVGGTLVGAIRIITLLEMTPQSRGATQHQGAQYGLLHQ